MSAGEPHFFRREYGRLVAVLSRRFGVQNLEAVEDAVQSALLRAVEHWPVAGVPADRSAWLYRVALNALTDDLRTEARRRRLARAEAEGRPAAADPPPALLASEVRDDLLRMLFACCDPAIPEAAQLVLALRTLCGFDVREIALRIFTSEANVYKRLGRARARLREEELDLDAIDPATQAARRPAVRRVLYLLFTEGYLSSREEAIRRELCDEAIRLGTLLADGPGDGPETAALLALMHLHRARIAARRDQAGGLLLLEEQDRSRWDRRDIERGLRWLERSAAGEEVSRYHAEASIAAEHCLAPTFAATRWDRVADRYALLERIAPSPLHRLNRAVAVAEAEGPEAGLALLEGVAAPTWVMGSYQWSAVHADLHRRAGHGERAAEHRERALAAAPSAAIAELLRRRLT